MSIKGKSSGATGGEAELTPKLRFPEFQEVTGWDSRKVDDLVNTVTPFKKLQTSDYKPAGKFPIIDQSPDFICGWTDDEEAVIEKGLPVIVFGDHTCTLKFVDRPFVQGADGIKIIRPKRGIDARFLFCALEAAPVKQEGYKRHFSILKEKKLTFPDFDTGEQQKIANCLGSVDELIAAQARKVEALRSHKKGLMQRLFPQEGETQPRRRFPEFEGAGEWEEKPIGDFGQVVTGSTPSTADPTLYGGGIPFVSPADISELRYVDETKTTLTAAGYEKTRPIKARSVLFVCIGSTIGKIAQNVRHCATNQQINAVIPNAKHSDGFVYFALSNASERIALLAGRQAVPIINKSLFSSVRLLVPSLPEQKRIADCLTSLDDLIAAESQKLGTLKTHKRSLMQQLFPQIEEDDA